MSDAKKAESLPKPPPDIETMQGIREVLERAATGEKAMRPLVLKLFDRNQREGERLMDVYGNSYAHARQEMTKVAAGKDLVAQEALRRKINEIRDELAGPAPTALERILCERVALCWFDAHDMDRRFTDQAEVTFKVADYRESRRDRAHKRFLAACKTLATVRRLGVPAIQVNVARQQVNLAGST